MSKRYSFWYNEHSTYKATFTASSLEQAEELLEQLNQGLIEIEDLSEVVCSPKDGELTAEKSTLAEVV